MFNAKVIILFIFNHSFDQSQKSNLELLLDSNNLELDWDQISREVKRPILECKSEWLFHKYPLLNFTDFSEHELEKLKTLAEKYNKSNWHLIANELGVGQVYY